MHDVADAELLDLSARSNSVYLHLDSTALQPHREDFYIIFFYMDLPLWLHVYLLQSRWIGARFNCICLHLDLTALQPNKIIH